MRRNGRDWTGMEWIEMKWHGMKRENMELWLALLIHEIKWPMAAIALRSPLSDLRHPSDPAVIRFN